MSNLVLLEEEEGQRLLRESVGDGGTSQHTLINIFSKQIGRSNCGLQSGALIMSAAKVHQLSSDEQLSKMPHTEHSVEVSEQLQRVIGDVSVTGRGISLGELVLTLQHYGHEVDKYHAADISEKDFREMAIKSLVPDSRSGVIVNYDMSTLGQTPFAGHHSPLGAFHQQSGRFLILDTWPDTKQCWATVGDLHKAMNTIDKDSGLTRGFCVVHIK